MAKEKVSAGTADFTDAPTNHRCLCVSVRSACVAFAHRRPLQTLLGVPPLSEGQHRLLPGPKPLPYSRRRRCIGLAPES